MAHVKTHKAIFTIFLDKRIFEIRLAEVSGAIHIRSSGKYRLKFNLPNFDETKNVVLFLLTMGR